jgi:hypothetical protein
MTARLPARGSVLPDRPHRAVADPKGVEMRSTLRSTKMTGALAAIAVAATIAAPAAYAIPIDGDPLVRSPDATRDVGEVPPPPSSIAASAAKEYDALRSAGAQDRNRPVASQPIADQPSAPGGFDWVSALIGAAAAAGLALVSMATLGMRKRTAGTP